MNLQADVLIVTSLRIESEAVVGIFKGAIGRQPTPIPISDHIYHDLGEVNGAHVFMAELNAAGIGASLAALQKSISVLHPSAVIIVGEAFGVNAQKQQIGDILISQQLHLYEIGRIDGSGLIPRGDRPHASPWLLNRFRAATSTWEGAKVHIGVILTGDKLIDSADYRDQLMLLAPDAIGGEMEGAGLFVACQYSKVDWILVKAISNWADSQKAESREQYWRLAVLNSASFVLHTLQVVSFKSEPRPLISDADLVRSELKSLSQQVQEIREGSVSRELIEERLVDIQNTAQRAIGRSEELTARLVLPPSEVTDVQLLPSGALDRLEEYRSDENIAYLLMGAFGGAMLGILSNWATNKDFVITPISLVLLCLFGTLFIISGLWVWRIHRRVSNVKRKFFANEPRK